MSSVEIRKESEGNEMPLSAAKVGMWAFLCSEAVFFATLLIAYITYIGATTSGPTPSESLRLGIAIINSVFPISSSFTVMLAVKSFGREKLAGFTCWMLTTVALGLGFLGGTAYK